MNKQQILELAKQDPRFSQAVLTIENKIGGKTIPPEILDKMIQMLELLVNNPDKYTQIIQAAVKDGMLEEGMFPPKPDPIFIMSFLAVMYGMQERTKRGFAKGGLAKAAETLRSKGRNDDTMLAHITPEEAAVLRARGGSGVINPNTGLPEFDAWSDFRDSVLKPALPLIIDLVVPGAGTALGTALGATGVWAPILGGALMGGANAALNGGNVLQGAAMGGLGGGLGQWAGEGAKSALGGIGLSSAADLGAAATSALGSGLVGGVMGAATGKGFAQGALQGAVGGYLGSQIGAAGAGIDGALGQGIQAGGQQFGNALAAGYDPKSAALMGGLSGLAAGISGRNPFEKPSDAVVKQYQIDTTPSELGSGTFGTEGTLPGQEFLVSGGATTAPAASGKIQFPVAEQGALGKLGDMFTAKNAMLASSLLGSLQGAPEEAQATVKKMSPAQQELFNRPNVSWDWNRMQQDAARDGLSLGQFMSQNWPSLTGYAQNGGAQQGAYNQPQQPRQGFARGGLSSLAAGYATGGGSGRDDTIDAKLSDGEYVFDAESVAMLGDGSNEEGARRLDQMRSAIRSHKGKTLAKGKISPNAKSPLAYMKGIA